MKDTQKKYTEIKHQEWDALIHQYVFGKVPNKDFGTFATHDWIKDEDGNVDEFAMSYDYHNGPQCDRCATSFCMHCTKNSENKMKEKCTLNPPQYSSKPEAANILIEELIKKGFTITIKEIKMSKNTTARVVTLVTPEGQREEVAHKWTQVAVVKATIKLLKLKN